MDDRFKIVVEGNVKDTIVGSNNVVIRYEGTSTDPTTPPVVRRRTPPESSVWRAHEAPLGRDRELREIDAHLDERQPVQVFGRRGYGKSTLLRHIGRSRADVDHVICLSANGKTTDDLLQEASRPRYDVQHYRPSDVHLRGLLEPVRSLLVLDDFDGDIDTVLDAAPGCSVLVASPQRTLWSAGRALPLSALAPDAASRWCAARSATSRPQRSWRRSMRHREFHRRCSVSGRPRCHSTTGAVASCD